MYEPLARSDYYRASALPSAFNRRRIYPTGTMASRQEERSKGSSRVHEESIDQLGIQLCPGSIATATPQTFTMTSPPARQADFGVDHHHAVAVHCIPAHIHQI
jgi:hypothetical protein